MTSFLGYPFVIFLLLPNVVFNQIIPTLPGHVKAVEYWVDLEVSPDPSKPLLNGSMVIRFELLEDTDEIYLNSQNLTILRTTINHDQPATFKQINDYTLKVKSPKKLQSGRQIVEIEYQLEDTNLGTGGTVSTGITRESYNDTDGTIRYVVSTQGEEFAASRYVPCFDEIGNKAKWNAVIRHESKYTALSNGKLMKRKDLGNGLVASSFQATPPMSSYLFTICVSEFANVTTISNEGVQLTVWMTPPAMLKLNGSQVLQNLKSSMQFLNSVLKPQYPLPKMDVFFAPWIGWAMENWGLITGMFNIMPGVLQHELSHQWFGDLVTAKSWDHYWLHEGFATYWEKQNFANISQRMIGARLFSSSLEEKKPFSIVSPHFNEVGSQAGRYQKGCALLYMLEGLVGKGNLWTIMNKYLSKHLYNSAVTSDFFETFDPFFKAQKGELHKINITDFGVQWTKQRGYPIIHIESDGDQYVLTQTSSTGNDERWDVPLFVANLKKCAESASKLVVLKQDQPELRLPKSVFPASLFANSGYGLYRLDYDSELFTRNLKIFRQNKCHYHETVKLQFLVDGVFSDNQAIREKAKRFGRKYFPDQGVFGSGEEKSVLDAKMVHVEHLKFF